jgi:hypothetical protein
MMMEDMFQKLRANQGKVIQALGICGSGQPGTGPGMPASKKPALRRTVGSTRCGFRWVCQGFRAEDEVGAGDGLFECFGFFDEADSSLLEGDYQLAGKLFRDDVQFPESTTELLFPDRV